MCDTFIILPDASAGGEIMFAKNSDRPQGEIQDVVACSAQDHAEHALVQCTYLKIPQVQHCYATILSKPRWMWGAEMGANEHGVVIGNEAVWTTEACKENGLLGMDLLRLGLERGATAREALEIIVTLLDKHGQGGNCAEHFSMNYHNSFLMADFTEAWLLETAGKYWVAEKITNGSRSISNQLSIRNKGDLRHRQLDKIIQTEEGSDFDFAQLFSTTNIESSISPYSREGRVRQLCKQHEKKFTIETAKSILRDHETGICMHGDFETRGSQISILSKAHCRHWFTEGPFPCQQQYRLKLV